MMLASAGLVLAGSILIFRRKKRMHKLIPKDGRNIPVVFNVE